MPLVKHGIVPASSAVIEKACNRFIHEGINHKLHCPASCHGGPTGRAPHRRALAEIHTCGHAGWPWDRALALTEQTCLQKMRKKQARSSHKPGWLCAEP